MSIVIICGNGVTDRDQYQLFIELLLQQMHALDDSLIIEDWPNVADCNAIDIALAWMPDDGVFNNFPNLKAIFSLGAGVDHILKDPNLPQQAALTRIIDPEMASQMSHYVCHAVLNIMFKQPYFANLQQRKEWNRMAMLARPSYTVGILGMGYLGQASAKALHALGINVIGWSRSPKTIEGIRCYGEDQLGALLPQCDIVVSLLPLTSATHGFLNKATLQQLPDGAHVINVSRGGIVIESDLIEQLDNDKLSSATLDVFNTEPLPAGNPLWSHPKVTVTPHISAVTNPTTVCHQLVDNIHALMNNQPLTGLVDRSKGY